MCAIDRSFVQPYRSILPQGIHYYIQKAKRIESSFLCKKSVIVEKSSGKGRFHIGLRDLFLGSLPFRVNRINIIDASHQSRMIPGNDAHIPVFGINWCNPTCMVQLVIAP